MSQPPKKAHKHTVNYEQSGSNYVNRKTPTAKELVKLFRSKNFTYDWTPRQTVLMLRASELPFLNFSFKGSSVTVHRFVDGKPSQHFHTLFAPTINVLIPKLVRFGILTELQAKKLIA